MMRRQIVIVVPPNAINKCTIPPPGWYCTRKAGHDGPCAAVPINRFPPNDDPENARVDIDDQRLRHPYQPFPKRSFWGKVKDGFKFVLDSLGNAIGNAKWGE